MVFPSVPPLYLDPTTWNQNQQQLYHNYQQQVSNTINTGDQQQLQRPAPGTGPGPSTNMGTAPKTNSMAERARLAKIPMQPEGAPLPCPRCESTNTKFCYFNNYSLAQPRHFCKACRRYWTRGGALRNVPVGGGTRRNNKRSSKSGGGASSSSAAKSSTSSSTATSAGMLQRPPQQLQIARPMNLPLMMTSSMIDYESSSVNVPNLGLGFSNMGLMNHIQQFPFLGGLEPPPPSQPAGIYPFLEGQVGGGGSGGSSTGSELMSQMESAKMEESNRRRVMNLERQYTLGMNISHPRNDHFWGEGSTTSNGGGGGGGWMANLSGFNSSTTGSLL